MTEPAEQGVEPSAAASATAALDGLRSLVDDLDRIDSAVAATQWDWGAALAGVVAEARAQVRDVAAAADGASSAAVAAVNRARTAVAEAVLAVAEANGAAAAEDARLPGRRAVFGGFGAVLKGLGDRIGDEVRHVWADKPRSILIRLMITLAISLSLVAFYQLSGMVNYDAGRLTLYLFSAVVGSMVCTNALCFEAERVRVALSRGERLWRILLGKNLAMAALVTVAGLPVITWLALTGYGNPVALVDQLITMVFIWLGVGNVLSVAYPLRHEPVSARLRDGTWLPYLFTFALSYGVGLTVNLMIYWRLWARQTAATEMKGGTLAAFALVLASAVVSWLLLTVFAVACSREPRLRRVLLAEMIVYRKAGT